jgi:hypothetical protein
MSTMSDDMTSSICTLLWPMHTIGMPRKLLWREMMIVQQNPMWIWHYACWCSPKVMMPLKMCVYISMAQVTFQQKQYHAAFPHFQTAFRIAQVMNECAKKHDLAMAALLNGMGVSSYYSVNSSPVNDAAEEEEEEEEVAAREHGGHGELLNANTPSMSVSIQ